MLTFENKAFRDIAANAPYDVVEILTNSATYGGGGIFGLYSTVAADSVWAPYIFVHEFGHHIAGAGRRVLHVGRRVSAGDRSRRAVGAERHGAARSRDAEVEGSRDAGHAAADAVAERGVRGDTRRTISRSGARDPRGEPARKPRWTRCSARKMAHDTALLNDRPPRGQSRRVRRRELRSARLLPAAGRLHHVHARQRAVLRRLPPRDRARFSTCTAR